MYESQINEYKFELDKLNKELSEVKSKYFLQKKKEHLTKEKDRLDGSGASGCPVIVPQRNEQIKFIGGGYSLKTSVAKQSS
jgi:hypothetical protein